MAKRFTDTELWDKAWFMKLNPTEKCLVRFIFDKCDNCGVWSPNWVLASNYIGAKVDLNSLINFSYRLEFIGEKIFVPDFIDFQYGELTETCKPHRPIIQKLKKYGLYERVLEGYRKGIDTLQEKEQDQEKETDQDLGKSENPLSWNTKPTEKQISLPLPEIKRGAVIELFKISKHTDVTPNQVESLWAIFKAQHFTGQKFYQSEADVYSHFINWCKTQNIEKINGTHKQTSRGSKSAGNEQLLASLSKNLSSFSGRTADG